MDVKPLHVILILALFGGLLALGMWGATESRSIQGPSDLRIDRLGRLHVRIDDKIFVYNAASTLVDEYALQDGRFAHEKEWQRIATTGPGNRARSETRPIDFSRIGKDWYVLAKTQDMRSGAIYRYGPAGTPGPHFTLPVGADPFALADFGGAIVVADYAGMAVHRYSFAGDHLGYLSSTSQDKYIAALQQRRRQFTVLEYGSWGLFALALIAGFAIAIKAELNKAKAKSQAAGQPADSSLERKATGRPHYLDPHIHWLQAKKLPMRLGFLAAFLFFLVPVVLGLDVFQGDDAASACVQLTIRVVAWSTVGLGMVVMVPVVLSLWRVARTRVGVLNEWVLVDHGDGNIRIARDEDLLRVANGFIIDYTTIPTGTPQLSLYDKKDLEQWLMPRLARATVLGPLQQTVWQWHNKRRVFIALLLGVIILLPLAFAVQGDWAENRFEQWLRTQPECEVNESGDDKNVSFWMRNN